MIQNSLALTRTGKGPLRHDALALLDSAWDAVDPGFQARRRLTATGDTLTFGGHDFVLGSGKSVYFIGCGKASGAIAEVVEDLYGPRLAGGVVVTPDGFDYHLSVVQQLRSDHPLPSVASERAGLSMLALARQATAGDLVICAITGGSSALACVPPPGLSISEVRHVHELLLKSGATIQEINTVRRHLSVIGGGRLAAEIFPATVWNVTVSDVVGDDLQFISDPTVANSPVLGRDAIDVLKRTRTWEGASDAVRAYLEAREGWSLPDVSHVDITSEVVVSGKSASERMRVAATALGYRPIDLGSHLQGESRGVGGALVGIAQHFRGVCAASGQPLAMFACGGEVTVALTDAGVWSRGGPNQELAVAASLYLEDSDGICVAAVDSDGADGGTHIAGGVIDGTTWPSARAIGTDAWCALRDHQSTEFLEATGDAIFTGPTGTNVNDMIVVLVR